MHSDSPDMLMFHKTEIKMKAREIPCGMLVHSPSGSSVICGNGGSGVERSGPTRDKFQGHMLI